MAKARENLEPDARKITVTLPVRLVERLDALVPARRRSKFIAQAVEEQLAIAEQLDALEETAGAWVDSAHPELQTEEAIDRWLDGLRSSWSLEDG